MYINILYPDSERALFTNREEILRKLFLALEDVKKGEFRGFSIFGIRRCGKTAILKEFFYRILRDPNLSSVYIDYEGMPKNISDMIERTLGWTIFWAIAKGNDRPEEYLTVETLAMKVKDDNYLREKVELFRSIKALDVKFRIILSILQDLDKPIVLILDEFQDFLIAAEDSRIDILGILRELMRAKTLLIVSGSIRSILYKISKDFRERYFLQLDAIDLPPFNFRDVWKLTEKIAEKKVSGKFVARVFRYTGGFPFYITVLLERAKELSKIFNTSIEEVLDLAYYKETFSIEGKIYEHCRYLWSEYLNYARRKKYLRRILELLSKNGAMTISELSKEMGVDYSILYKYVEELESLGLVRKEKKQLMIFSKTFATWILMRRELPEISRIEPKERLLLDKLRELEKRVARAEKIASKLFESYVQMVISENLGEKLNAKILGITDLKNIRIPDKIILNPTKKIGGKVYEVDAILEDDSKWVVEITISRIDAKYIEEIKRLWKADIYWFISYEGFTESALKIDKNNVILSTRDNIEYLMKRNL